MLSQVLGFPDSSVGKETSCHAGDPGSIPGSGRSPGEGTGCPLLYSWASLVAQSVRIHMQCGRLGFSPWAGTIPWRREQLLTPVFLPGEFHGQTSLAGYVHPWGHKESNTTERFSLTHPEQPGQSWEMLKIRERKHEVRGRGERTTPA